MLTRETGYLKLVDPATQSDASRFLEREGYLVQEQVFSGDEIKVLRDAALDVYATRAADVRNARLDEAEREDFRYEMLNHCAAAQQAIAHPFMLSTIEPLLGEDCHVIANTCWRNPPRSQNDHGGGFWHIDAGPHIPRPADVPWDSRIPYPVFAIGVHIYLQDCPAACGPTGVIPRSHTSGQSPPQERLLDAQLTWDGRGVHVMEARAGDVAFFVSDIWHRRMPAAPSAEEGNEGRFFLQVHYGRRDIAQRLRPCSESNQLDLSAVDRAVDRRARQLIGLHDPFFYDG